MSYKDILNKMGEDLKKAEKDFIAAEKKRSKEPAGFSDPEVILNYQKCKEKFQYAQIEFMTFKKTIEDLDIALNNKIEKPNS